MFKNLPTKEIRDFLSHGVVLIIEPRANYRNSIKRFLANLKVERVKMVSNVDEARREMLTSKISMFICEWNVDGANGLKFCRELRGELSYKTTPFLLLSVDNLKKDVILAAEVLIDGYLLKPFSFEDFAEQIVTIMKNHTQPNRLNSLLRIAEERMERGDLSGAEKILYEVLKLKVDSARALCNLADIQDQRGHTSKAIDLLKQATSSNSEYIRAYKTQLAIAERDNKPADVLENAMYLNAISPDNPKYNLIIAKCHLGKGNLDMAEDYFKKTISLSPMIASAYKGLGNLYMVKEEYDKAMKNFSKALDLDKEDISILNSYGMALVRLEKYEAGIEKYQVALSLAPHNHQILFNIGHAFEKQSNYFKAEEYYQRAIGFEPEFPKAIEGLRRVQHNQSA